MTRRALTAAIRLIVVALPACLFGCHRQQPVASAISYTRVDAIAEKSGGNWSKVPPADKKFLIQEYGSGNERVATMIFNRRAARMTAMLRWTRRVDAMVERSGGDWNKLSDKDRGYLVTIVNKGDEQAAMKTFQERAALKKSKAQAHR